ncbi:hypothetical protein AB0M28_32030 [Streptomyces sp. NPDC051940]|uniref:hypothetical protein n=1 Tax=Streptomyces sp. NPDC051940 TaxID=3155675 RepID=UPI00341D4F8B
MWASSLEWQARRGELWTLETDTLAVRRLLRRARRDEGARTTLWRLWLAAPDGDEQIWAVVKALPAPRIAGNPGRAGNPRASENPGHADGPAAVELSAAVLAALGSPEALLPPLRRESLRYATWERHPVGAAARALIARHPSPELVDEVCEMALDLEHLAELCRAEGFVPSDELRRAVFLVRTGRFAQLHAQDPDGVLLRAAYLRESPPERAVLRDALVAAGELELVRGLTGEAPRAYASKARDPRELARLLWRLPLAEAVATVHDVPGDVTADHPRLRLLRDADAERTARAHAELTRPAAREIPLADGGRDVKAFATSYDGTALGVVRLDSRGRWVLTVVGLPDGRARFTSVIPLPTSPWGSGGPLYAAGGADGRWVVATGDQVTSTGAGGEAETASRAWRDVLGAGPPTPRGTPGCRALRALPQGGYLTVFVPSDGADRTLVRLDPDLRPVDFTHIGSPHSHVHLQAVSPSGAQVVTGNSGSLLLHDLGGGPTRELRLPVPEHETFLTRVVFPSEDTLAVVATDRVWLRRLTPDGPRALCSAKVRCEPFWGVTVYDGTILTGDGTGAVALRADSLTPVPLPVELPGWRHEIMECGPDRRRLVLAGQARVKVFSLPDSVLARLARRPLASLGVRDIALLDEEVAGRVRVHADRRLARLLRACAELNAGDHVNVRRSPAAADPDAVSVRPTDKDRI